jgi:hypothetical protein
VTRVVEDKGRRIARLVGRGKDETVPVYLQMGVLIAVGLFVGLVVGLVFLARALV